jgi:hypothetical protein
MGIPMKERDAVRIETFQTPEGPGIAMQMNVDYRSLASSKEFVEYFCNTVADKMAAVFVEKFQDEFFKTIRETVESRISDDVAKQLFPDVLKQIDVAALVNSVLLAAGSQAKKAMIG